MLLSAACAVALLFTVLAWRYSPQNSSYLGADHCCSLSNAAQGLAQVTAAAHKGHLEVVLVDVVDLVSRGQHLHVTTTGPVMTQHTQRALLL
jgi:hypothetical protein